MTGPSLRVVPGLAAAQLRRHPGRWLLVAVGVALSVALVVGTQGMATLVADRALRQGLQNLPVGDRSVVVSYNEFLDDPTERQVLDTGVRQELTAVTSGAATFQVVFRELADSRGGTFLLGAANGLENRVSVTSGRLPARCDETVCEVVIVGDALEPAGLGDLGLEVVGRVERTDPLLLSGRFESASGAPLLLADGVDAVSHIPSLSVFQRVYSWVAPVDLDRIRELGVDGYLDRSSEVQTAVYRLRTGLILAAPDDVIRTEADRAQRSSARFALLGGSAAALLLGFAVVGALGLRRDQGELLALLRRRGADRRQVGGLVAAESAAVVGLGAVLGLVAGGLAVAWLSAREGLPTGSSAADAVGDALLAVLGLSVVAGILVAGTLLAPDTQTRSGWRRLDLALGVVLLLVVVAVSRGGVSSSSLDTGTDPLLVLLPLLVSVAAGLLAARLWPLAAAGAQRLLPRRSVAGRLALLGGLRSPVRVVATTALLAAAVCSLTFAGAYRSTLAAGAEDRAVFETGLDARVTTGPTVVPPLAVASVADYAGLAPGGTATPIVRNSASARQGTADAVSVTLLGVDPSTITLVPRWDRVVGGGDPHALTAQLAAQPPAPGPTLPGPGTLSVPASGSLEDYGVTAWFRAQDSRQVGVPMRVQGFQAQPGSRDGTGTLTAKVPDLGSPTTLVRLAIRQPTDDASRRQHALGERDTDVPLIGGRFDLSRPTVDGAAVQDPWTGWGSQSADVVADDDRLRISFQVTGDAVVVGPGLGSAPAPLPVAADPTTAALAGPDGLVTLNPGSNHPLVVQVVATLPRFPTTSPRFVLADGAALGARLDAVDPGEGSAREVWVSAPDGGASLAAPLSEPPYDHLGVALREERAAQLAADPVARGASTVLVLAALVALLVAVAGLVLLVVTDRRDDAGELYAWEVDGVGPSALRRLLVARSTSVLVVAVPMGLAAGLLLAGVTARLVGITATGSAAQPPPQLATGGGWVAGVLVLGIAVAMVVVAVVASSALREQLPVRSRS